MFSDQPSDDCLRNFPIAKNALDPNDAPFLGSLPDALRVFKRVVGYDLRFLRAGSSELDALNQEERDSREDVENGLSRPYSRKISFPVGDENVKLFGRLVLSKGDHAAPRLDWDDAQELTKSFAATLSDNYRWRSALESAYGELAATCVKENAPTSKTRSKVSIKLRAILRAGARALGDYDAAALYLLDDDTTVLVPRAVWGLPDERLLENPRPLRGARAEIQAFLGNVVVVNDDYLAEAWNAPEDFVCSVCAPVISDSNVLGALWFFSNKRQKVDDREMETLSLIAERIVDELEKESAKSQSTSKRPTDADDAREKKTIGPESEAEFDELVDSILANVRR